MEARIPRKRRLSDPCCGHCSTEHYHCGDSDPLEPCQICQKEGCSECLYPCECGKRGHIECLQDYGDLKLCPTCVAECRADELAEVMIDVLRRVA